MKFRKHYTQPEASALLPQVRVWLGELARCRTELAKTEAALESLQAPGVDLGGTVVNRWLRTLASLHDVAAEFERREIQIKDLDRCLIDFPAIIGGKEVFLCWEEGEEDVQFWHDLDSGYAGREHL